MRKLTALRHHPHSHPPHQAHHLVTVGIGPLLSIPKDVHQTLEIPEIHMTSTLPHAAGVHEKRIIIPTTDTIDLGEMHTMADRDSQGTENHQEITNHQETITREEKGPGTMKGA